MHRVAPHKPFALLDCPAGYGPILIGINSAPKIAATQYYDEIRHHIVAQKPQRCRFHPINIDPVPSNDPCDPKGSRFYRRDLFLKGLTGIAGQALFSFFRHAHALW